MVVGFSVGFEVGFSVVLGRVVGFVVITVVKTVELSIIEPGTVALVFSSVVFSGRVLCESAVSPFGCYTSAMIISSMASIIPSVSLSLVSDSRALMSAALTCEP